MVVPVAIPVVTPDGRPVVAPVGRPVVAPEATQDIPFHVQPAIVGQTVADVAMEQLMAAEPVVLVEDDEGYVFDEESPQEAGGFGTLQFTVAAPFLEPGALA